MTTAAARQSDRWAILAGALAACVRQAIVCAEGEWSTIPPGLAAVWREQLTEFDELVYPEGRK